MRFHVQLDVDDCTRDFSASDGDVHDWLRHWIDPTARDVEYDPALAGKIITLSRALRSPETYQAAQQRVTIEHLRAKNARLREALEEVAHVDLRRVHGAVADGFEQAALNAIDEATQSIVNTLAATV